MKISGAFASLVIVCSFVAATPYSTPATTPYSTPAATPSATPYQTSSYAATPKSTPVSSTPSPTPIPTATPIPCAARVNFSYSQFPSAQLPAGFQPELCQLEQAELTSYCITGPALTSAQGRCVDEIKRKRDLSVEACIAQANSAAAVNEFSESDRLLNFCECLQGNLDEIDRLSDQLIKANCDLGDN